MDELERFLHTAGVHPALTDLDETLAVFTREMEAGLAGKPSSLPMIPSYIGEEFAPAPGECVAAVDAGGTNLRVSKVRFGEGGRPSIEAIQKFPMPGSQSPVDMDTFFSQLAGQLSGILEETQKIGFCFSYPVEILPSRDGRVLSLCKEVVVHGIEGAVIGEKLQQALAARGARPFTQLTVLNDTTASLLGGRLFCPGDYSSYIGFILGTGTNICYYEDNARITKAPALCASNGKTIVNLESGEFDKMAMGDLDNAFTARMRNPESHRLEKMMSGQYMGALLLEYLRGAQAAGVFSAAADGAVQVLRELTTKDVCDFLAAPRGENVLACLTASSEADRLAVYRLAEALLERAAKLVAVCYAACAGRTGAGKNPLRPILITAEGTTYYKCELLKQKVDYYMEHYLRRGLGLHVKTARVDDAVTFGAALSAVCR